MTPTTLDTKELAEKITGFNQAYRAGTPLISDHEYDHVWLSELQKREPNHPLLTQVEDEGTGFEGAVKVKHPFPMLSTDKAYTQDDIKAFVARVNKAAAEIGINPSEIEYRVTPKLDGMAGRLNGKQLVSRGESKAGAGYDISKVFEYGVQVIGNGKVGEFVTLQSYFDEFLTEEFEHPRGVNVGIASCAAQDGSLNPYAVQAIKDGAVRFVTYDAVDTLSFEGNVIVAEIDDIYETLTSACEYPTDGIVIEVTNEAIKQHMGHNSHHHKWQIAKKVKGEMAEVKVVGVNWFVSRTGRVNPVVQIERTELSGCTIENPTGHHAGRIRDKGINTGAIITILRAGAVIPHIEMVNKPVEPSIPEQCPCCSSPLEWETPTKAGESPIFLRCPNIEGCSAQVETKLLHFFQIHGNVDGFGRSTINKLVEAGYDTIPAIYTASKQDLLDAGFGSGEADVLIRERKRSLDVELEDWRFIGCFAIHFLGRGNAKKLLEVYRFNDLGTLSAKEIESVAGFGKITAPSIANSLQDVFPYIQEVADLGFNLIETPLAKDAQNIESPISGKNIVFTGAMVQGVRNDMKKQATAMGAKVQSSVNGKTNMLICGNNVGAVKINKAKELGVTTMTESEYLDLIVA